MKHQVLSSITCRLNPSKSARAFLILFGLSTFATQAAWALPTVAIDGRITRGAAPTSITMTLKMQGIAPADQANIPVNDFAKTSIALKLPKCPSNDKRLGYIGESVGSTTTETSTTSTKSLGDILDGYQVSYTASEWVTVGNKESYTYNATFTIKQSNPIAECLLSALIVDNNGKKGVNVAVYFKGVATHADKVAEKISDTNYVYQSIAVANEAPSEVVATPSYLGIDVTYTKKSSIKFKGDTESTDAPTGVVAFLVASDEEAFEIPGKTYQVSGDETFAPCRITPGQDTCLACDTGVYVDIASLRDNTQLGTKLKYQEVGPDTDINFNDLDANKTYNVALVYQPDGLVASACSSAQPRVNFSLTELNEDNAKTSLKNPSCFIATAAYGSPLDRHIDILRAFRNHYMLSSSMGKSLVRFYYTHSPKIAAVIEKSEAARWFTRLALAPIVSIAFLANEFPVLLLLNFVALCVLGYYLMLRRGTPRANQ